MSTKIYVAWRVKVEDINKALNHIKSIVTEPAYQIYAQQFSMLPYEPDKKYEQHHQVVKKLRENQLSLERRPFEDISFEVWMHYYDGYFYLRPAGEISNHFDEKDWKLPDYFQDFCYWNNADEPDEMPAEEWDARRVMWDTLSQPEIWDTKITSKLIDAFDYHLMYEFQGRRHRELEASAKK